MTAVALRTAFVLKGLPDTGLVHRISRGRLWIPVLALLLGGIVALNVVTLGLSTGSGRSAQAGRALARQNSELRALLARRLSNERVQSAAARIGMVVPEPGEIRYLTVQRGDARRAALALKLGGIPVPVAPAPALIATPTPAPALASAPAPTPPATTPVATPTPSPAPVPTSGGAGQAQPASAPIAATGGVQPGV